MWLAWACSTDVGILGMFLYLMDRRSTGVGKDGGPVMTFRFLDQVHNPRYHGGKRSFIHNAFPLPDKLHAMG